MAGSSGKGGVLVLQEVRLRHAKEPENAVAKPVGTIIKLNRDFAMSQFVRLFSFFSCTLMR